MAGMKEYKFIFENSQQSDPNEKERFVRALEELKKTPLTNVTVDTSALETIVSNALRALASQNASISNNLSQIVDLLQIQVNGPVKYDIGNVNDIAKSIEAIKTNINKLSKSELSKEVAVLDLETSPINKRTKGRFNAAAINPYSGNIENSGVDFINQVGIIKTTLENILTKTAAELKDIEKETGTKIFHDIKIKPTISKEAYEASYADIKKKKPDFKPIDYDILASAGIDFKDAMAEAGKLLKDSAIIAGHNLEGFDKQLIEDAFKEASVNIDLASKEYYDTLKEARKAFPGKEVNLSALRRTLEESGRKYEGVAHDATADIAVTADVMKVLAGNSVNLSTVMDKVSTELESMVAKIKKVGDNLTEAGIAAVGALEGMGYNLNSTSADLIKAGSSAIKSLNSTIDYSDKAVLRMKDLSKARSSIQSAIFESQPVYPLHGDPNSQENLRYRQVVTKGFDETKNASLVKSLESLSTSLGKLQNNMVKSLEQGLRNGWKVLEGDKGEKFKLAEGNREWELSVVNVDRLRNELSKSNVTLGPGATAAQVINEYKTIFKKDMLSREDSNESMAAELTSWLSSASKDQLSKVSDTTKNLAELIKSGKINTSDLSNNRSLRDIYSATVLESKAMESLRGQFIKSISVPVANVSAQGTLGFETKYGSERSLAKFATITTGIEKLANEFRDLGGNEDAYSTFMQRLSAIPFRTDKYKNPETYDRYSKLADDLLKSVKDVGGKEIISKGLQDAINLRLEERGISTEPQLFDTTYSMEELEKKAKDLGVTALDVAKAMDSIKFENFYDVLDRLYQTGKTPFITEKAYGISGSEGERSIRQIASIKDELLGAMPLVEPGRPKRSAYDEDVVKILTRQVDSANTYSKSLRPEEQKQHIVDVALTWQEIADNLKKLNPKGEGIPTARPIDLSDSSSSQLTEFNNKSTSALKDLNKIMVSASTADIRAMAPFEKFSSISRQMSYSANALAGALPGGSFELPSLVSEKERGMIESGKYGTGGYGLNVLTELRNTAATFEDQIIISGRLAEAFTRIVKPLVGPAASIVQDIKPMEGGKTVALSKKGKALHAAEKGADPKAFEKMVEEVTNKYQEVLGVPKTYAGRADIATISDDIQNVMRVHRGESVEVQTAKLTETFMNYFGRKLSTRFGTKGVSITPPKVPTEIKELQDVATAMSAGLVAKVEPGAGLGYAKMSKSTGSLLSEMITSRMSNDQINYEVQGLDRIDLGDLAEQLEKSGNKFIIDLFNNASYGIVTEEEASKQKALLDRAMDAYVKLFGASFEFGADGILKLSSRSLKSGAEGIRQIQEKYTEITNKPIHTLQPIEARISSRGIAKRGLMPEVLEGMINNLVGTTAESTTIKNADITNNADIRQKINEYMSALDFKGLSEEERGGAEKRLRTEMGNKPGSEEAIQKLMDFEKQWSVYTDVIDEYGKTMQSFVAPKFLQIVEEPNLYKEWNPNEIDKGLKGEKLNFQAYAAYAGVFGEGSKMLEEVSKATSLTSREGWELIRAMQMLDPSMQKLTKTMMQGLDTVKLANITPFDDSTATVEGLKGTIFDIGKYPAPFKVDIPSVNRKGEVSGYEPMYIPGPTARSTYPEELMGGKIAPTNISRYLSNLISAAQKVEDILDISRKGVSGMDEETATKFSNTLRKELEGKLTGTYNQFRDIESKRAITPENVSFMEDYIKDLKNILSTTTSVAPIYMTSASRKDREARRVGPQTEREAVDTYESELKAQGGKNMYSNLLSRMMDIIVGPNPVSLKEEEQKIAIARRQYAENQGVVPANYTKTFETQGRFYHNNFTEMLDAFQKRIEEKRAAKSRFDIELEAGNLHSFAQEVGLDLSISVKDALERALDSLSRAKVSYFTELSKNVLGPKQAIEQTFFQRVIPSSVTAKAVTAITDKTDELAASLDKLKNIKGIPTSVIQSLEDINAKHKEYITKSKQLGMPVLKEGEIGIHPDMAKQIKLQQAGREIDLAKMMSENLEEPYVNTVRYPFTGTLSVQSHKAKLMESDLYRHSLAVPGAPELDTASMQLDVLGPLNKRINDIIGEREQAWSSGSSDKAKELTSELETLIKIVKDITPKFTNMEQKLDFDGDALFLHTGQVEDSRKEIANHFNAMGKDVTSVRSLFNTVFSAVKETDVKSLAEMAYIFSKKQPSEKGFSFLEKPYIEKDVANLSMPEIFKSLSTYEKVDTKDTAALDKFISNYLGQSILPEVFRKAGGTEEQQRAFGEKAISSFSGGGGGIPLGPDAGEFEITATKLLEELVRRKMWEQKYSDSIVGQLYKLHTGQTVEGISRIARMSEIETGFGTGVSKSGKNVFEPSKEFLSKWPKESASLGEKPVEEFAARMNEVMRFVIQKGLDEKHAGVKAVGSSIINNIGKKGGAASIMKVMKEESKQFDDLWAFNDEIVKSAKIRLGSLSLDELRSEVKTFEPDISNESLMKLSRQDIIGNPKAGAEYNRGEAGKIIPHIDLQAVFEELFRMIERQAIKGFIKATQEKIQESSFSERVKVESDVARAGGFENYAKAEIKRKAASEDGISILKYVTTNLEPLYRMRTSMENIGSAGSRSYIKPDTSDLAFTKQTKNAVDLKGAYASSLKAAHTLSRSMSDVVQGAQGGAHSLMVLTSVQKRMDELNSVLEQANKLGIPTKPGATIPTTSMEYAGGAYTTQAPSLFTDIWKRANIANAPTSSFEELGPMEEMNAQIERLSSVRKQTKNELDTLSQVLGIPMMNKEEEQAAFFNFNETNQDVLSAIDFRSKMLADELSAKYPEKTVDKTNEIKATTERYTEFMQELLKFQIAMSEQARRVSEAMKAVPFQKSYLETAFPGIASSMGTSPIDLANEMTSKRKEERELDDQKLVQERENRKELILNSLSKQQQQDFTQEYTEAQPQITSGRKPTVGELLRGSKWESTASAAGAAGGAAGGGGGGLPPGGRKPPGGPEGPSGEDEIESFKKRVLTLTNKIHQGLNLNPEEWSELMSLYLETIKRSESDLFSEFKERYDFLVSEIQTAVDPRFEGGFEAFKSIAQSLNKAKQVQDKIKSAADKIDAGYNSIDIVTGPEAETAKGMHTNLKSLLEVSKLRHGLFGGYEAKTLGGSQEIADLIKSVSEQGPSSDVASQIMEAVKKLPTGPGKGNSITTIWQYYRKAVGEYFIKELDRLRKEIDNSRTDTEGREAFGAYAQTIKKYRSAIVDNLGKSSDIYTEKGLGGTRSSVHPQLAQLTSTYRTPDEIMELVRQNNRLSGEYEPIMSMLIGPTDTESIEALLSPLEKVRKAFDALTMGADGIKKQLKDDTLFRRFGDTISNQWDFKPVIDGVTQLRAGLESWNRLQTSGNAILGGNPSYTEAQRTNIMETIKLLKQLEKAFIPPGGTAASEMGLTGVPSFLSTSEQESLHRRNVGATRAYFAKTPEEGGPESGQAFTYRYKIVDPATKQIVTSMAEEFRSLGTAVNGAGQEIGVFSQKNEDLLKSFQDRKGFGQALGRVIRWGAMSSLVWGTVSALKDMVDTISDVEMGIANLRQVMSPLETNFEEITSSAIGFAKDFGMPIRQVVDSMKVFAQQGLSQAEVIDRTRTSALAANVTTLKTTDATEALTAAAMAYSDEGKSTIRFLDAWSQVEAAHAVTANDLANAITKAGSAAKTSGVNFDQFNALVTGIGETTRMPGKEVGTSLRFIFRRLQAEEGPKQLGRIGIPTIGAGGDIRSSFDILGDLASKWDELSQAQKLNIAQSIGGTRHYNELIILMEQWTEVMDALHESTNSKGAAERRNAIVMDTYAKKLEQVRAAMTALQVEFGKFALPIAKGALTGIKSLLEVIANIPSSVKIAFVSIGSLFTLLTKGGDIIDKIATSFTSSGNVLGDFTKSLKTELSTGLYEVFGKGIGGFSLEGLFKNINTTGLKQFTEATDLGDMESGLGKATYLVAKLGRGWNNFLTDLSKGGASTTSKVADAFDYIGDKLIDKSGDMALGGGPVGAFAASITAALGSTSEVAGYGTEKIAKLLGLTSEQMARLTKSSTGVVGAIAPMVGSFFALKPLLESSWDGFKKLALSAADYEKSVSDLKMLHSGELSNINNTINAYDKLEKRLSDINASNRPEVKARLQEREEYKSPLHELGKLYGDATEYGNKLSETNIDLVSGFDQFGNAVLRTTDNMKGYLEVLASAQRSKMAETELGVMGAYVKDLTKTTGLESFKNEFKKFLSEIPVIGESLAKSIKVSPAKSIEELREKIASLIELKNKYPLTTSFDIDLKKYNEQLAKARESYKETYNDFVRVLKDIPTEGLNPAQISEMLSRPEFREGFDVVANIEPRLQTGGLKGKVSAEDILGTEVLKKMYPNKSLDFTAQLTKGLLEQSNIKPRDAEAFAGDIVLFTDDIAKKYEIAGNQAILKMQQTSEGIVEWTVQYFDKELLGVKELPFDKVSKFVESIFPVQAISDRLYENIEVLKEFVAGAGAGLRGITQKTFKKDFNLGERFFSQLPTTTLLQTNQGYEPGQGFGNVKFKAGWDKWIEENFFKPMTEYTQLLDQLKPADMPTGESELSPGLTEDISKLQDVLKNNQVVLQYRAVHEDLIKVLSEGDRALKENIESERNRNKYIVQSSGYLKGLAEDMSDVGVGVQKYTDLTAQQRLAFAGNNTYTTSRQQFKEGAIERQSIVDSINNIDKSLIAIREIGDVARSFGAALPSSELANYAEEIAKTGDRGTGLLLGETQKVVSNTADTVTRLDQLLEQGGDESTIDRIISKINGKDDIVNKLESLTEKRNKAADKNDIDMVATYDRAIDKLTSKLVEQVGPEKALKAVKSNAPLFFGNQDFNQAEFIKRALGNTNFDGFGKALERVQPGITKTKEFSKLISLQGEQATEQIVSNKNLNKILAVYSTMEHFNKVSSNRQISALDTQIKELETQRRTAQEAGAPTEDITTKITDLTKQKGGLETKAHGQAVRELIAPIAIASQELAKAFGVTEGQLRVLGGGVGGFYLAWKAWEKLTGEPIPEYLKELGGEAAAAAEKMSQGGIKGGAYRFYYGAKDLVFGKNFNEKLKSAEEKIKSEKVLTDEEVNKAKETIIGGASGAGIVEEQKIEKKEPFSTSPIEDVTKLYDKLKSTLKGNDERLIDRIKKAMSNPEEFNKLKEDVLKVAGKKDIIDTNAPSPQDMLKALGGKVADKFKDILRKYGVTAEEETVIYGGEKAEDSEVRRPGKPESLGQAVRRAMEQTKAESKAKSMSSEDKILDENSAQTGILSGIYEQVKRTAENTTGFSGNLSDEIKAGREDRKDETDAVLANVDKIREEYLAKQKSTSVDPLKQIVAALLAATAAGYVDEKTAQLGRNNELENRADEQVDLLNEIIKKYPDSIAKAIGDFNTTIVAAGTPVTTETEKVQKAVDTEAAEKDMVARLEELRNRMTDEYDRINDGLEESAERISRLQLAEEMKKQLDDLSIAIKSSQAIKDLEKQFGTPTSGLLAGKYTPQINLGNEDLFNLSANESLALGSEYERPILGKVKRGVDNIFNKVGNIWSDFTESIGDVFNKATLGMFEDTYSDMAKEYESGTAELSKLMETASNITTEMVQIQASPMTDESEARYEALEDNLSIVTDRMDDLNESLKETAVDLQKIIVAEEMRLRGLKAQADANVEFATNYAQSTTALSPFSYLGKQGFGSGGLNLQMPAREEDISVGERALLEARRSNNKELENSLIGYSSLTSTIGAQSQQSTELAQTIAKNYVAYDELSSRLGSNSAKAVELKSKIDAQVEAYNNLRSSMSGNVEQLKQFGLAMAGLNLSKLINDLSGIKRSYTNETQAMDFKDLSLGVEKLLGGSHPMAQVAPTYAALKSGISEDQLLNLNKYQLQKAELFSQEGPGPTLEQINAINFAEKVDKWVYEQTKQNEELKRQQSLSVESMTAVANAIKIAQERGSNPEELASLQSLLSSMQEAAKHMSEVETTTEDGVKMYKGFGGDVFKDQASGLIDKLGLGKFSDLANPITGSIDTNTERIVKAIEGQGVSGIISKMAQFFGIGNAPVEGKATGGFITGPGGPREDRVLKAMSPGEYVLKASSTKSLVRKYGADTLHSINDTGSLPSFDDGGKVKEEERVLYPILRDKEGFAKRQAEAKAAKERKVEALKEYSKDNFIKSDKPKNSDEIPEGMVYDEDLGGLRKKVSISEIMDQVQSIVDTQAQRNKSIDVMAKAMTAKEFKPADLSLSAAFRSAGDKLKSVRTSYEGKGFEYSKDNTFMENLSTTGKGIGSNLAVLGSGVLEAVPRLGEWAAGLAEGLYGLGKTVISKGTKLDTYKEGYKNVIDFWSKEGSLKEAASLIGEAGLGVAKGVGSMFTGLAEGDIKSAFDIASTIAPIGKMAGLSKISALGKATATTSKYVSWADQLKGVGVRSGIKKSVTGIKDIIKGSTKPMSKGFMPGVVDIMSGITETVIGAGRIGKDTLKIGLKTGMYGTLGVAGIGALAGYGAIKGGIGLGKSLFRGIKSAGKGVADIVGDTFGNEGKVMSKLYREVSEVSGKGPKKEIAKKWQSYYKNKAEFENDIDSMYKQAKSSLGPVQLDDFTKEIVSKRKELLTNPSIIDSAKTQFINAKSKLGKTWSATKESVKFGAKKAYYGYGKQDIPFLYRRAKSKLYDIKEMAKTKYTKAGGLGGISDKVAEKYSSVIGKTNKGLDSVGEFAKPYINKATTKGGELLSRMGITASESVKGMAKKGALYAAGKALTWATPYGYLRYGIKYLLKHPELLKNSKEFLSTVGKEFAAGRGKDFLSTIGKNLVSKGKGLLDEKVLSKGKNLLGKSKELFGQGKELLGKTTFTKNIKELFSKNPFSEDFKGLMFGKNLLGKSKELLAGGGKDVFGKVRDYTSTKATSLKDKLSGYKSKFSSKTFTDLFKKKGKKGVVDGLDAAAIDEFDALYGADESIVKRFTGNLNKISEDAATSGTKVSTAVDDLLKEYGADKITGLRNSVYSSDAMTALLKEYGIGTGVKQAAKPVSLSAEDVANEILNTNFKKEAASDFAQRFAKSMESKGTMFDNMSILKEARKIVESKIDDIPETDMQAMFDFAAGPRQASREVMESLTGLFKSDYTKASAIVNEFMKTGTLKLAGGGLVESPDYSKIHSYFNSEDAEAPEWNPEIAKQLIDLMYEKNKDNLDSYYLASDLRKTTNWKDFYNKILEYSDISDKALASMPQPMEKGTGYDLKGGVEAIVGKSRNKQLKELADAKYRGGMIQRFGSGGSIVDDEEYIKSLVKEHNLDKDESKESNKTSFKDKMESFLNAGISKTKQVLSGTEHDTSVFKVGKDISERSNKIDEVVSKAIGGLIQKFKGGGESLVNDNPLLENEKYIDELMKEHNIKPDTEVPSSKKTSWKDRVESLINAGISKTEQLMYGTEHDTSVFKVGKDVSKRNDDINKIISKATGGGVDSVLAAVSPGEFIINRNSVRSIGQKYGVGALDFMNDRGELPKFARGGMVSNYQFADGGKMPYDAVSASSASSEGIDPQKIGDEIGASIARKLESLEFKPVRLASDTVSISEDSIKALEKSISKVNDEGVRGGVGADTSASKIDAFIEATNSRLETFSVKINEQDNSINDLSSSIDNAINSARDSQIHIANMNNKLNAMNTTTDNIVTKEELDILSTQADSKLNYKIHEAINFIEERYLVGFRTDISVLNGRVSDLQYDLNDTKDRTDANISRLGLRS